ncbi:MULTISPECIES: hypothetical protein [Streptomyces]|uniref:hypothetical protein n=1 Tax=Streptomyces TaxID=1883 RepID=UPI0029AF7F47|nr:hypothetical protein [Streptomyces sp. WI03-4A]MDX2595835.1 hypothetical protein [Streptomyces sp. WI03-4A]
MSSLEERDEQVALLCDQLPRLRRMHRGPVGAAKRLVIDRAVRAARDGEPVEEYLSALGLLRAGTAPEGGETAGPVGSGAPGTVRSTLPTAVADDGPHAVQGEHVCPRGVCARRERRWADRELPVCEVFDLALRFDAES